MAKKALVVDDIATERVALIKILKKLGIDAIEATTGREAIDKTGSEKPDVIFMDVVMPDMNGFQACREITRNEATKSIPIIMVSTKNRAPDEFNGKANGARDYIFKPADEKRVASSLKLLTLI